MLLLFCYVLIQCYMCARGVCSSEHKLLCQSSKRFQSCVLCLHVRQWPKASWLLNLLKSETMTRHTSSKQMLANILHRSPCWISYQNTQGSERLYMYVRYALKMQHNCRRLWQPQKKKVARYCDTKASEITGSTYNLQWPLKEDVLSCSFARMVAHLTYKESDFFSRDE